MGLRYRDLGPVWLERDGSPVKVPAGRLSAALSVLLAHANHRVSTDSLLDALWGEGTGRTAQTLESHVFRLRKLLEPEHQAGQPYSTLLHNAQGYQLLAAADQVDSMWFEQLAAQARDLMVSGQPERARARCEQALSLWRGRPWTPNTDAAWAAPAAARLEELRADVASQRIDALLALGQIPLALADLEELIGSTPLRERLWAQRMLGLHRAGRTDEALQAYQRLRELLIDELGVEPGPDIRSLHARILDDDPALTSPPAAAPDSQPTAERRKGDPSPKALSEAVILPRRRMALIGREQQTADLAALVVSRQLVTVVGTAGCGKTSISIEAARRAAAHFPGGVVFVDLSAATELNQALDAVTSTLQLPGSAAETRTQSLIAFTRNRRMLLILDNCEQLLEDIADIADALLGTDTELSILVTSREPLNLDDEAVFVLAPLLVAEPVQLSAADTHTLAEQPAVKLFLARLQAAAPHQAIGPADIHLIARICTAVDGVPLAIELAAAQSRAYTLAEILNRVQHNLVGLAWIGRGANRHHSSLRTAIDLSTAALPPDELAMHRALAVVPGPVTPGLAAALTDQPVPVAETTLVQLLHRSMLTSVAPHGADRPSRFAQLATIRSHANSSLHPDQRVEIEARRDAWVCRLAAQAPPIGNECHMVWQARINDDLAAVRATLQHRLVDEPGRGGVLLAARLAVFWNEQGMTSEWERWTRLAHAQADQLANSDHLLAALSPRSA